MATKNLPSNVYGNRFNIQIQNDIIYVSIWGSDIEIEKEGKALKEELDNFLEGILHIINCNPN